MLTFAVGASLLAQAPPGQGALTSPVEPEAQLRIRRQLGEKALADGDFEQATHHFQAALGLAPTSPTILRGLLAAAVKGGDADAGAMWAIRWWLAVADERGSYKPDRDEKRLLSGDNTDPHTLAAARAAAVEELVRYAQKLKTSGHKSLGNGVLARWATDLAWQLMRDAPALREKHLAELDKACAAHEPDYQTVLQAVRKTMTSAAAAANAAGSGNNNNADGQDPASLARNIALRAARILTGLGAQARFKDLKGPKPPDLGNLPATAKQVRAKLRQKINKVKGEPLTIEQLKEMTREEREAFTQEHATWANPGFAVSPNARYLVQTVCGFETLLGVAETVEMHHARLANWFGKDPFKKRQGLVRIVPEAMGLESEDVPFWWAGGFQRGDLTTVKFSWGSIGGLGHTLTHELTHRFDGTIYPFQPAWLVEGKAVWTGAGYGRAEETNFVPRLLRLRGPVDAFLKGYGGPRELQKLIEGTIDDYRDNYSAGYALWVYLWTWTVNGKPLYKSKLNHFMSRGRAGQKKKLAWFLSHFADGKGGRPKDLREFATRFYEFLHGCYKRSWGEGVAWMSRYRVSRLRGGRGGLVMDQPTWIWSRTHAEPWFGQRHAQNAGHLLAQVGRTREAAAALCWSLRTDGWSPPAGKLLAELLRKHGFKDAAWVVEYDLAKRRAGSKLPAPAPMLSVLPRLRMFQKQVRDVSRKCFARQQVLAARALAAEHNRLGRHSGTKPIVLPDLPRDTEVATYYPLTEPAERLGLFGWDESDLTRYEERRRRGLWYETADGDLHVGRKRPRKDSGLLDRRAHQRDAFVRTREWQQAGDYVFRTRVHFTTSFVSGALILGYTRRDRNIRLRFGAGNFMYSIGRSEQKTEIERMFVHLYGLWDREGNLRSQKSAPVTFEKPKSHFDLEVRVSGPTAMVFVDKQLQFSYSTPDLSPIEGYIGFAMGHGAVRLQQPTVQRLDRRNLKSPQQAEPESLIEALGQPIAGIPTHPDGTIVVWLPVEESVSLIEAPIESALRLLRRLLRNPLHYPQKWVLAVPKNTDKEDLADIKKFVDNHAKGRFTIVTHQRPKPFDRCAWGLFVDGDGVLRAAVTLPPRGRAVGPLQSWARKYRARSE
ncbi:MAG: hypothetical protein ACYTFN_21295 [Planctomycetota bacterium]